MGTPELGVRYVFVRVEMETILYGFFTRYGDSSGFIVPSSRERPDLMTLERDNNPDEWPSVLADLSELGFVELSEAKQKGLVPPGWVVPAGADDFGAIALSPA